MLVARYVVAGTVSIEHTADTCLLTFPDKKHDVISCRPSVFDRIPGGAPTGQAAVKIVKLGILNTAEGSFVRGVPASAVVAAPMMHRNTRASLNRRIVL